MAGGTYLIDANGKLTIDSNGKADVCEACCAGTPQAAWNPRVFSSVDGYPAIVFSDADGTAYVIRATNAGGTAWSAAVEIYVSTYNGWLLGFFNLYGAGTYQYAYAAGTHTARLGSTATNPNRLFIGLRRSDATAFLSNIASNDQATSFSSSSLSATAVYSCALLLPTDKLAYMTSNAKCWVSSDADGSSFSSYDCYINATYAANIAGRPAICTEYGIYLRADDNTGTAWTNSPTSTLSTPVFDLKEVNSLPAMLIQDTSSPYALAFIIGDDADASGWSTPVQIPTSGIDNGEGYPSGAIMEIDGSRIYVNWGIFEQVPVYGAYDPDLGYAPIVSYEVIVWESYSDDDGATWSTPSQKYVIAVATSDDQYCTYFDRQGGKLTFCYYAEGGILVDPILYYEGAVVAV